jgi:tetratricopeptide (TPR) repeat protein
MIEAQRLPWERRRLASVTGIRYDTPARRRRSQGIAFLLLIVFAIGTARTLADPLASAFDAANKLYEQAKYIDAAAAYEKLLQKGQVSEALYFNWGNALFKSGNIGRAIAAYQEAQGLAPRDPDVRANLQFARNQVPGPTLLPDRLSRWLGKLNLNEWTCLAAGGVWLWLLLLTLFQWRRDLRAPLKSFVAWIGLVTAGLCACFVMAFYSARLVHQAIIVAPETVARQAPLDESQSAFTLHDGAELQILDQKDQWLQVEADPRRIGWVRKADVLLSPGT